MSQIQVEHLVKEYKRKKNPEGLIASAKSMFRPEIETMQAVDNVNFAIEKGEAVGYVGPNGSGKSTTIKMLCGILKPTTGSVRVNGLDPFHDRMKNNKNIGVVFGNRSVLWWDVPVIESFRLFQTLYEIPEKRFKENLEKFTEIMDIAPLLSVPERQLSLGQKMRCNIAAAFLHDPQIVYLDEPTIGLDTESKASIRRCISKINEEEKTTFIITSHDFQDIESLCRRIILINHGKIVLDDNMQSVKQKFNQKKQIQFEMEQNPWHNGEEFICQGVRVMGTTSHSLKLEYDLEQTDSMKIMTAVAKGSEIQDVNISGRDIEEIIRDIIRKDNHIKRSSDVM
ncbi:MAG: ATP-binding cassette domain-containing protein [Hespellia sp.]|nr:ATP-binding cassette domain-containing protein [Hespellia sp.]